MKKKHMRDTPIIVISKGYAIDKIMDFDDECYENGDLVLDEEVRVVFK